MNHIIIPICTPDTRQAMQRPMPQDKNDPEAACTAIEILIPVTFSEKAQRVMDYLEGAIALFQYKGRFVLTDEGLDLTAFGHCGPRWTGDSLEALEAWLEETCDGYDANPADYPGWISLDDPKEWDWSEAGQPAMKND